MDPAGLTDLDRCLSRARLAPYVWACGGDPGSARRLHTWNVEASAAFLGPISLTELAVRNAVHDAMTSYFGRADWWNGNTLLRPHELDRAFEAEQTLLRQDQRRSPEKRTGVTADDVVAALSFGFWARLLGGPERALVQHTLWERCLHAAFPHWRHRRGDASSRKAFLRRIELIRKFRNRVAHHEPIHQRQLAVDHQRLIEMAGYVDPRLAEFIEGNSRLPAVLDRKRLVLEHGCTSF